MKYFILFFFTVLLSLHCGNRQTKSEDTRYTPREQSLSTLAWIEGNWKGMDGNQPFYEVYRLVNDSTLQITSYDWNGKDSSKSSPTYLTWKKGAYYLGDSLNYKLSQISDSSVYLTPNYRAANTVLWKKVDSAQWQAVLRSAQTEKVYRMERVHYFEK